MDNENRTPTLESLLRDMIANQHSIHDDIQDIQTKLIEIERKLEDSATDTADDLDDDVLYESAKEVVIQAGQASTSFLQRKLRIGYSKAAMLMDKLEVNEIIDHQDGSKPRTVITEQ